MPMLNMRNAALWLIALSCVGMHAGAQTPESLDLTAVGKDPRWKIDGRTTSIVDAKGKHALKIGEGQGMGVVWLDGFDFANVFRHVPSPGDSGLAPRATDRIASADAANSPPWYRKPWKAGSPFSG